MRILPLLLLLAAPLRGEEVMVFAAASLTDALTELGRDWERGSGHKAVFNFGASSDLARQIVAGAPADVIFSADVEKVRALEAAGVVRPGEVVEALSNALVVVVPATSAASIKTPADLVAMRRIALADPEAVPAGVYARRWLESRGLWDALRPKVVPALDVRAALAAVAAESVDAGIVYRTDAATSSRVRVAFEVPAGEGPKIAYALAPLAASRPVGRDLVRFLLSERAQRVYRRLGFIVVAAG